MDSLTSNEGIFQVSKKCKEGGIYFFKSHNNCDEKNSDIDIKVRPHLLINDTYSYGLGYQLLRITSTYVEGMSIPVSISGSNRRLSFVSISAIISAKYETLAKALHCNTKDRNAIFLSDDFVYMCRQLVGYKLLKNPISERCIDYLKNYLDEYNSMVKNNIFNYNGPEIPIIEFDTIVDMASTQIYSNESNKISIISKTIGDNVKYTKPLKMIPQVKDTKKVKAVESNTNSELIANNTTIDKDNKYYNSIMFIIDSLNIKDNIDVVIKALLNYGDNKMDIRSVASVTGISYNRAYYYLTKYFGKDSAVDKAIKYKEKQKQRITNNDVLIEKEEQEMKDIEEKVQFDNSKNSYRKMVRKRRRRKKH